MTKLLEKAFSQAQTLPDARQDAIASRILEEMDDEARWDRAFSSSPDTLERLADEAEEEDRAGRTKELDWRSL